MLRTRLWMGALLVMLAVGVLVLDREPYYPFLFSLVLLATLISCHEFLTLLGPARRPAPGLCYLSVVLLVCANWPAHLGYEVGQLSDHPWHWVLGAFVAVVLGVFLTALATYRLPEENQSGDAVPFALGRMALALLVAVYLGLLPCFLVQLRWPTVVRADDAHRQAILALLLAIFVPKCCDIGAYFTGRLIGRHRMTPVLSPKKTWEGLVGGLILAAVVAVVLNRQGPALPGSDWGAIGFGLTVGLAGVFGDLAESFVKRECRQKDASQALPGFGGVLDVVDSIVFAAPVAYCWLNW